MIELLVRECDEVEHSKMEKRSRKIVFLTGLATQVFQRKKRFFNQFYHNFIEFLGLTGQKEINFLFRSSSSNSAVVHIIGIATHLKFCQMMYWI